MKCQEVMRSRVKCVNGRAAVRDAARTMREANVGFLPICDDEGHVLGTVTDRDLAMRVLAEGRPASTAVVDVMTREVVACRATDDLRIAQRLMSEHRKSRVMCTDDEGRLLGVISLSDLAQIVDGGQTLRAIASREARL